MILNLNTKKEYFWCSKQRNCMDVFIIKAEEQTINFGYLNYHKKVT